MDKLQILTMVKLESSADTHPNKQPFKGILTKVGSASTKAPIGSNGKIVVLSAEGAVTAVDTLKGMPLNVIWDNPKGKFTGHDQETVIGIIAESWIQENDLWVEGYLFPQNYPVICASIRQDKEDLGFSYELLASSHETKGNTMLINEFTFIGACICFKDSAAYGADTQLIAATLNTKDGNENMDKEVFQGLIDAMLNSIDSKIAEVKASVDLAVAAMEVKVEASAGEVAKVNAQVEELAVALAETKDVIKASVAVVEPEVVTVVASAIPVPTVLAQGQTVVPAGDIGGVEKTKKQKIAEIYAGDGTIQEKMRKVVKINAGIAE